MTVEPGPFRDRHRPYPDPDHSLAPRRPRTLGGMVYIGVLALAVGGLVVVVLGHFRAGLTVMGGAMLLGAVARLAIPGDRAGMLGVRRKLVDVTTLVILGGGLLVLAVVIPDAPPT